MAGFFKKLFGSGELDETRKLSHPCNLREGDFLKFKFLPQDDIGGKTFSVFKVNTCHYDGIDYPEMILKDTDGNIIFMMVEEEDGEEYLCLSKKVPKAQIRDILPQEALDSILEQGTGTKWEISVERVPEELKKWIVEKYTETDEFKGKFSKGDARVNQAQQAEDFKSYTLTDPTDEYALEVEIYGENELELSAIVYHDINIIEELLPGSLEK